jgi:hypothetical protein
LNKSRSVPRRRQNLESKPDEDKIMSTTDAETDLPSRHSQSALLSELLKECRKKVTFESEPVDALNENRTGESAVSGRFSRSSSKAYPTEQAVRQKESLKVKKEAGGEIKKKKQIVEAHADDCGMDLSGIEADIAGPEMPSDDIGSKSYWASGDSSSSTAGDPASRLDLRAGCLLSIGCLEAALKDQFPLTTKPSHAARLRPFSRRLGNVLSLDRSMSWKCSEVLQTLLAFW